MARRKKRKSILDWVTLPKLPSFDLDPDTRKGIFIVFILALGGISALSLFDLAGTIGIYIKTGLILGFGWGRWIIPVLLLIWGYFLYDEERFEVRASNYLGMVLFILSFHALLLLFVDMNAWPEAIKVGRGGGYAGLLLADTFVKLMGFIASLFVLFCLLVVSLLLMLNTTLVALFGRESFVAKMFYPVNFVFIKIFGIFKKKEEEETVEEEGDEEKEEEEEEEESLDTEAAEEEEDDEKKEENHEDIKFKSSPVQNENENSVWWAPTGFETIPPINLLSGKKGKPTSGDIKENKIIIEKALNNFGIPVEMGEISVGPTVTQYTFRPAEGVKLSKITNLSNDLALALAAHPIRIEAPIPGKHLVGVEVPNQAKAIVGLKETLLTKDFKERKNNLMLALGKDVAGKSWLADISKMPHLLVAGATNSGKSVCLNAIIVSLLYQNNPDDLRFIMVDPKRVELPVYNGIPHLLTPVITYVNKTINALKWCLNEMDRRFDILSKCHKRNIQTYNESAKVKMPYVVFIIDELADLMVAAAKDIEAGVIRLAQMARAVGIHLVLATQRPSVDVITGLIKANSPARIAFSVASGTDSRTILDSLGAEKLLGRGDMLFINAEISKPKRLQGAFVDDDEIKKIVTFIKKRSRGHEYLDGVTERQKVKGVGGFGMGDSGDDFDDLFEEAKEIIINQGKASATLLQRRLSVGYARAARILDELEQAGIVGRSNGAKGREILISKEQYAATEAQGISGVSLHSREDSKAPDSYLETEEEGGAPVFIDSDNDEDDDDDNNDDEETSYDASGDDENSNEDEQEETDDESEEEEIDDDDNEDDDDEDRLIESKKLKVESEDEQEEELNKLFSK